MCKSLLITLGVLVAAPLLHADALPSPEERIAADQAAKKAFHELNFFSEGGGMHMSPGLANFADPEHNALLKLFKLDKGLMQHRWGVNWNEKTGTPHGFYDVPYKGQNVGVLGCVACHSGRAAGRYIIGLGNKNIDTYQIGKDLHFIEKIWRDTKPESQKSADYKYVENTALEFSGLLGNSRITNLTEGLVPTAVIRTWFFKVSGTPIPDYFPRSAVKVPSFWGYGEKRKTGQFCDGVGNGNFPGWGIAVELVAGQKPEVVRNYLDKISHAEDILGDFLPPKYPYVVDMPKATRGKALFENTCAHCHGTYEFDSGGLPIYKEPKYIKWEVVKTDRDRLDGSTPQFYDLVKRSPLNDIIQANPDRGEGYFAPRLHAIWARFPYLHNASVPNVRALLTLPENRPKYFSLDDAGEEYRFDSKALGLKAPRPGTLEENNLKFQVEMGSRAVYSTTKEGQSNQGHNFYTTLPDDQKDDLIEYLKTL